MDRRVRNFYLVQIGDQNTQTISPPMSFLHRNDANLSKISLPFLSDCPECQLGNSCVLGRVAPPCIIRESLVKLEFQVFHLLFQNNLHLNQSWKPICIFQLNKYSSNIISIKSDSGHKHAITLPECNNTGVQQ